MFVKPTRVRFLKSFTSPVFGNVWEGREVNTKATLAEKMIAAGIAEEVVKKNALVKDKEVVAENATAETVTQEGAKDADSDRKSSGRKGPFKGK